MKLGAEIADNRIDHDPLLEFLKFAIPFCAAVLFFVLAIGISGCETVRKYAVEACENYREIEPRAAALVRAAEYGASVATEHLRAQEAILIERMEAAVEAGIIDTSGFQLALEGLQAAVDNAEASLKRLQERATRAAFWYNMITGGIDSACSAIGTATARDSRHGHNLDDIIAGLAQLETEMYPPTPVGTP